MAAISRSPVATARALFQLFVLLAVAALAMAALLASGMLYDVTNGSTMGLLLTLGVVLATALTGAGALWVLAAMAARAAGLGGRHRAPSPARRGRPR